MGDLIRAKFWAILPAGGLALLAALSARAATPPTALTFIAYGQSTMVGPVSGDAVVFQATLSNGSTTLSVTVAPTSTIPSGSAISCQNLPNNPPTTVSSSISGTGSFTLSAAAIGAYSGYCYGMSNLADQTLVTPSNVNSNAFMITTSPILGPRGMWETLSPTNSVNNKPVLISAWSGFSPLKEAFVSNNYGNGGFHTETPLSSFVAQFIAQTGWAAPNAIIAENMAHGGEDWAAIYPNILAPGGNNDWTDFVTAQKYVKNGVQGNLTLNGGAFTGGPWNYRMGGVPMRLGETAAAAGSMTVGATPPSTASTSFLVTTSPNTLNGVSQPISGWCVYDYTASAFLGYAASWVGTTVTLQANSLVNGAASDSIYISPCYPGYLAELRSMVAQLSASDISDAPDPGGVPIFAALPSSSNFGGNQKFFQFAINAAYVTEALADRRMVVTGPSFMGTYQSDTVHQLPQGNAIVGAYQGKWAAWNRAGLRTPPFSMISAQRLGAGSVDGNGAHYGVRVTFQMPPSPPCVAPGANGQSCASNVSTAQQQVLQFYSDSNIPAAANYGFCYLDGAYPAGGSQFAMFSSGTTGSCLPSASGIAIAATPILATANSHTAGGQPNQIDIALTGDPSTATNPTITLGAYITPNGTTLFGVLNAHIFLHNVANKDCTTPANPGLSGAAFKNAVCDGVGTALNYLLDFAAPSFIGIGQTLTTAW